MTDDTTTQEVQAPATALDPVTGQILELAKMSERDLGEFLDAAKLHVGLVREAQRAVKDEVLRRMDRACEWTIHAKGGFEISGDAPGRTTYDVEVLRRELAGLVKNGTISKEARDRALKRETVYKPVASGINALRKLGGEVAKSIERAERAAEKPRDVRVKAPPPEERR
jgi:hypothetical protein